jgi:hypothetical protein
LEGRVGLEQHVGVTSRRTRIAAAGLAAAFAAAGLAACSQPVPEQNPAIKLTGNPQAAMPTQPTTTTSTTTTTTTTLYWLENG